MGRGAPQGPGYLHSRSASRPIKLRLCLKLCTLFTSTHNVWQEWHRQRRFYSSYVGPVNFFKFNGHIFQGFEGKKEPQQVSQAESYLKLTQKGQNTSRVLVNEGREGGFGLFNLIFRIIPEILGPGDASIIKSLSFLCPKIDIQTQEHLVLPLPLLLKLSSPLLSLSEPIIARQALTSHPSKLMHLQAMREWSNLNQNISLNRA